jgi:Bleomycin resistance protein-like N-terminal
MNSVVHFEMPYDDRERMAKFYGSAFGWQTQMLGEEMGSYVLATTTESDERGPKRPAPSMVDFFQKSPIGPHNIPPSLSLWTTSKNQQGKSLMRAAEYLANRSRYLEWGNMCHSSTPRATV